MMRQFGVGDPGLQTLHDHLRLVQTAAGGVVGRTLGLELVFQLCDSGARRAQRVLIAATIEHHDGHTAILHEFMPGTCLISALLRRMTRSTGSAAQSEGLAHAAFGFVITAESGWWLASLVT